jgi:hypothetical protein
MQVREALAVLVGAWDERSGCVVSCLSRCICTTTLVGLSLLPAGGCIAITVDPVDLLGRSARRLIDLDCQSTKQSILPLQSVLLDCPGSGV